jgi:hypothetical protein
MSLSKIDRTGGYTTSSPVGPQFILLDNPKKGGAPIKAVHTDGVVANLHVKVDKESNEISDVFAVHAFTLGEGALYHSMDLGGVDRLISGLQKLRDAMVEIEVGSAIADVEGFEEAVQILDDEEEEELLDADL